MSLRAIEMTEITAGLPSKSEKIRRLHAAGCSRSEIANFLDVRYQFVRNVLVDAERRRGTQASAPKAIPSSCAHASKVRVGPGAQICLPAEIHQALTLKEGDTLIATLEEGEVRLLTVPVAVRKAQAIVRRFVPENVSLVDQLLEDRRREAESDDD